MQEGANLEHEATRNEIRRESNKQKLQKQKKLMSDDTDAWFEYGEYKGAIQFIWVNIIQIIIISQKYELLSLSLCKIMRV